MLGPGARPAADEGGPRRRGQTVKDPSEPNEPLQRHLAILSVVVGIAAAIVSIVVGVQSIAVAVLILAACGVVWMVWSGYGRRKLVLGRVGLSLNVAGTALLLVLLAVVVAAPWQKEEQIGFPRFDIDKDAPPPQTVASASACIADLKRQYSCHAFRELVANSPSLLMSHDPDHMTLDEPLELATAIGQGKMITEGAVGAENYCALYETSISEACNMLAGGGTKALR
jgi:hypothetical protein